MAGKVETVRRIRHEGMVLRLTKIPCGKANCTKCPHGPYWYLEFRSRGKWRHKYLGKNLDGKAVEKDAALARMVDLVAKRGKEVKSDDGGNEGAEGSGAGDGGLGEGTTAGAA